MVFKNPFKAVQFEMGGSYRAEREGDTGPAGRNNRKALLRLVAWGLLAGVALGATALLLRSQDFSWIF